MSILRHLQACLCQRPEAVLCLGPGLQMGAVAAVVHSGQPLAAPFIWNMIHFKVGPRWEERGGTPGEASEQPHRQCLCVRLAWRLSASLLCLWVGVSCASVSICFVCVVYSAVCLCACVVRVFLCSLGVSVLW